MPEITATIDWVRHGFSCANILQHTSRFINILRPVITQDAVLTKTGIDQATILNEKLEDDYDIICCSHLRRAMETALYGFNNPEKKQILVILPYISEIRIGIARILGLDKENQSVGINELKQHWNKIKSRFNFEVDFSIIENPNFSDFDKEDYGKFIKLVLPEIINRIHRSDNKNYKIAIVSHSHFITQIIEKEHHVKEIGGLKNTEIWREEISMDKGAFKGYLNPKRCNDKEVCQIYSGILPSCGEISTDRCKNYHNTVYNKIVPDTIEIKKCDTQKGGELYNYKYIKYKQK